MPKLKSRTLADFKVALDRDLPRVKRIKSILDELGDGWVFELELCRAAHVSSRDIPRYRTNFATYCVEIVDPADYSRKRFAWCGTMAFAKKLKAQAVSKS